MKKLTILLALLLSISAFAFNVTDLDPDPESDKDGTISGVVYDKDLQQPIPYVTVVIKDLNGEIITGGITDDNGIFKVIDIPFGKVNVSITFIGYKTYSSEIDLNRKSRKVDMGRIELEEDVEALDEVLVVAENTTIKQKLDRKVITVGKDLITAGPTASDIMNNLPSVNVDQQTGAISLRGNQNVQVMVDGKLSNVPVDQLLKQIPSNAIKQIELITNPSAKYNPEGMSGIINIILHKNVKLGTNGNISTGVTWEKQARFNGSFDINYRNGKFNLYGNYSNNVGKHENYGHINRTDFNNRQTMNFLDDSKSNLFKAGVDFYLNEKNTISVFTTQNLYDGRFDGMVDVDFIEDPSMDQTQIFFQETDNISSTYNFNYKLDFEKEGHNIELEADLNRYDSDEATDFKFVGASPIPNYLDGVDTERERLTVNLDYVNPLTESTKLEFGLEARLFNTNLNYESTGLSFNSNGELIPTPSTEFDYTRDIYSAYATYGKTYEKWSYQVGARFETVEVKADTNSVSSFKNDYFQVYPSAFLTYTPTEKNQYQISYSRRVDRPGISQVNPIREWTSPLISSYGNTNLEPQFTNSAEFNYTRTLKAGSITAGVFYRIINDEINRALFIDRTDTNKQILTYDNFDESSAYGVEVSGNYRPTKWWMFNASFDMYSQEQSGFAETLDPEIEDPTEDDIVTEYGEADVVAWNLRMFNNFKVTKKLTLSAFGFYRGTHKTLQFEIDPMYFVNLGARYSLWEGRGTFSVNYNDIFDTMKFGFNGQSPYEQTGEFNWESNTINVSLSYRFGGGKYRAKSRKQRDQDEKSGGGGGIF
jgi:outer membrane receptor protein involved in Fe transport